jgi:hypothetical protein
MLQPAEVDMWDSRCARDDLCGFHEKLEAVKPFGRRWSAYADKSVFKALHSQPGGWIAIHRQPTSEGANFTVFEMCIPLSEKEINPWPS